MSFNGCTEQRKSSQFTFCSLWNSIQHWVSSNFTGRIYNISILFTLRFAWNAWIVSVRLCHNHKHISFIFCSFFLSSVHSYRADESYNNLMFSVSFYFFLFSHFLFCFVLWWFWSGNHNNSRWASVLMIASIE